MRITKTLGLCAAMLPAAAGFAQAVWTGQAGTNNWYTQGNWSTGMVPHSGTDVTVPPGFPMISCGGIDVRSINAQSPLQLYTATAGIFSDPSSIKDATITGGLIATGLLTFTGDVFVQAGYSWVGVGGYRNTGNMTVVALPLSSAMLTNDGNLKVTGSFTVGGNSAYLVNQETLELSGTGKILSGGHVMNDGTWKKTGAGTSEVQPRIDQGSGSVTVEAGVMQWTGGGMYHGGSITINGGAVLELHGPFGGEPHKFNGLSGITGGGDMVLFLAQGGTPGVIVDQDLVVDLLGPLGLHMRLQRLGIAAGRTLRNQGKVTWGDTNLTGPGILLNEGSGTINLEPARSPWISGQAVVINRGLMQGSAQLGFGGGAIVNRSDGVIVLTHGYYSSGNPQYGLVQNEGTIEAHAMTNGQPSSIATQFEQINGGITRVPDGAFSLQGGGTLGNGRFEVGGEDGSPTLAFDAGVYVVDGVHFIQSSGGTPFAYLRGVSTMQVREGGALNLNFPSTGTTGTAGFTLDSSAALGGPGLITNSGVFHWKGQIGWESVANFTNFGLMNIPAGSGAALRGGVVTLNNSLVQRGGLIMQNGTIKNMSNWTILPPEGTNIGVQNQTSLVENQGQITVVGQGAGSMVSWSAKLDNRGTVSVESNGTLAINGQVLQLVSGELIGGNWTTASGGKLLFTTNPYIHRIAGATVSGSTASMPWLPAIDSIVGGRLDANGDLNTTNPLEVRDGGTMGIEPGARVTIPQRTTILGWTPSECRGSAEQKTERHFQPNPPMLVTPALTVRGVVRPGGPDEAGPFNLTGTLEMQSDGRFEVELGGLTPEAEHDRMAVTGNVSLNGMLDLQLLPGFVPQLGQSFTVLTWTGQRTGTFATVRPPAQMPAGLQLSVSYIENSVVVEVAQGCYANCDGSSIAPVLTANDFQCFLNQYAAGSTWANCDGSTAIPSLTANDFQCYLNAYAAGCGR